MQQDAVGARADGEARSSTVAWVESPLQLLSAVEHAALVGAFPRMLLRVGPQMAETARELLDRGAPIAQCVPYLGIPWRELAAADEWLVGDAMSGQFQLAAAVLRPRRVTLLDDGDMSLRTATALADGAPLVRPGAPAAGVRGVIAAAAGAHLHRLAHRGDLAFTTVYPVDAPGFAAAATLGVRVQRHRFGWLRAAARPVGLPSARVVLGSARVADGLLPLGELRRIVGRIARDGDVAYLPHRREVPAALAVIAGIPGVTVLDAVWPAELRLAGAVGVQVVSLGSSAATTLGAVLADSGCVIRSVRMPEPAR